MANASNGNAYVPGGAGTGPPSLAALSNATSVNTYQGANFGATQNVPVTVANITGGPGIITRIWFTEASLGLYNQTRIQVYIDGETVPSLDLDVGCLPGTVLVFELPANAITGATRNLEFGMSAQGLSFNFLYPIPFASSAVVKLVSLNGTTGAGLYANVEAHMGITSARRLKNVGSQNPYNVFPAWSGATAYVVGAYASSAGTNYICTAAHTNQAPPNAAFWAVVSVNPNPVSGIPLGNGSVILGYVPNTPLWVVGMGFNFASGDATWMENSPMIYDIPTNTSPAVGTASFQSTGFEDICGSAFYFMTHQPYLGGIRHPGATTRGTVTATASPMTFQNQNQGAVNVVITGGTVSLVELSRDGATFDIVATASPTTVYLAIKDRVRITYSVAPTIVQYPVAGASSSVSSNSLILSQVWDNSNAGNNPQYGGGFKDFLAQNGGIRCANGLLMRFEAPAGKATNNGLSTTFGWNILYYI